MLLFPFVFYPSIINVRSSTNLGFPFSLMLQTIRSFSLLSGIFAAAVVGGGGLFIYFFRYAYFSSLAVDITILRCRNMVWL